MAITLNASTSSGFVQSADTSGEIELQSNGTTALKVNTNEGVQILNCLGVGNATPSTSGAGITFPATQSASTDANTLDDYEEGSWTPTIKGASSAGTSTYSVQTGKYIKIGTLVFVTCYVTWNTANGTGNLRIGGLPFAGSNAGVYQGLALSGISSVSGSTSGYTWFGRINNGESEISVKYANFATTTPNDGDIAVCNSGTLLFTGTYTI